MYDPQSEIAELESKFNDDLYTTNCEIENLQRVVEDLRDAFEILQNDYTNLRDEHEDLVKQLKQDNVLDVFG